MSAHFESCRMRAIPMILLMAFTMVTLTPMQAGAAATIHVDDSAPPNGNGSAKSPFRTIQEGIDNLPPNGGRVLIEPGTYIGPIPVDRDGVILRGNTTPVFDADAFLTGFTQEVVITIGRPLFDSGISLGEPEDIIEFRGSNNELYNVVVEVPPGLAEGLNSAVSAKAEDDDFYDDIVFRNILVRGEIDTAGWSRKANAVFENITARDGGFVGINPTADGHVAVHNVDLANWSIGVCFLGLWELPKGDNESSVLTGEIKYSRISGGSLFGLYLVGQGFLTNPDAPTSLIVEAEGVIFDGNQTAIRVQPVADENLNTGNRFIHLRSQDNTYMGNSTDADVQFHDFASYLGGAIPGGKFVRNSTVIVEDGDRVFPSSVNLGPPRNGNSYLLE
jgi:hypothetical protein